MAIMNHRTDRSPLMISRITLLGWAAFLVRLVKKKKKALLHFTYYEPASLHLRLIERTTRVKGSEVVYKHARAVILLSLSFSAWNKCIYHTNLSKELHAC